MSTNLLKQQNDCRIVQTKKTVEWLINNTDVRTFDKVTFKGYQRKVNENHVSNIVKYLENNNFYLPTSIICSSDEVFNDKVKLYIVDGQHRVEAFKSLKQNNSTKYNEVKDYEVSVIVLEKPSESLEVDTFITINKTSRKVDTSLAYILKNKINRKNTKSDDLTITKKEFLAVELGILLSSERHSIWSNKILLEGNPTKNSYESISLNSFVISTRVLISYLEKYNIISVNWSNENELDDILDSLKKIYLHIWNSIKNHWPNLFNEKNEMNNVIQGNIGVSSLNKYIVLQLKKHDSVFDDVESFNKISQLWIKGIKISEDYWYSGNQFSKFSSESGFNIVANMLFDAYVK